jgi:hypothetical protein
LIDVALLHGTGTVYATIFRVLASTQAFHILHK